MWVAPHKEERHGQTKYGAASAAVGSPKIVRCVDCLRCAGSHRRRQHSSQSPPQDEYGEFLARLKELASAAAKSFLGRYVNRRYRRRIRKENAMGGTTARRLQLIWPWQDRNNKFSWLKASVFTLIFAPGIWLVYQVAAGEFGPVPLGGMTYWSGVWATALLLVALAITPALTITQWGQLILVRRMIGVAALAYTIAHIIIYFALRFWNFASIAHEMVTRLSLIVASIATIGLIALGATSVDAAVRRMGAKGWQQLHNAIYAITALALIHYLLSPDAYPEQYLMSGMFFWLMGWRVVDRRGHGSDVSALALLAVSASLFAAFLEAGWLWAYHDYEPLGTLDNNLNLVLGVSPAWKVLILGLLIALGAASRQVLGLKMPDFHDRKIG
jgi:methionine sulfoxide reductase heme-binding subunit